MKGLIVLQPYADQIINGDKEFEHRKRYPAKKYMNIPIYLISECKILGIIKIIGALPKALEEDIILWRIKVIRKYKTPKFFEFPNGAQVWIKKVKKQ